MAKSVVETAGVDEALHTTDQAQDWARCLADSDLDAFLLSQRALILFRGGLLDEALDLFSRSLRLMTGDDTDVVRVLVNRGALYVERGELSNARADLEKAVGLSRHLGNSAFEHIAVHNLGCLEFTAGDLPKALRLMENSLNVAADTLEGLTHLDRSRVLLAAGLPDEADAALRLAAELFRRDRCWQDLGEVDLTRAEVALLTSRLTDARRLAGRARDRFRRHGNDRWRRAAELVLLHADHAAARPAARLLPHAERLAEEFAEAGLTSQRRTTSLLVAELELDLGHLDRADAVLREVGPLRSSDPITVRLQQRLVRASSADRHGDRTAARRSIASGLEDLATYQAQFGGIDLQSASAVHGRRLAERDLELALRTRRPGSVLAAVERSRAVSGRIRSVTPPADERAAALLAELRQASDAGDATRKTALQTELRSRSWLTSGSRAWHPSVRLTALHAAAAADDLHLVTIAVAHGRVGAVTVPAEGRPRLVELAGADEVREARRRLSADLDVLANAGLPEAMRAAVTRSLRRTAGELGRLLAPAFPDDDRAVVVSPSSELLSLPWPLVTPTPRPLTVSPSLSGWHRARARVRNSHPAPLGNWELTAAAGPGLIRATQETAAVVSIWQQRAGIRDLPAATAEDLLAALTGSRVVHVAAHGVHQAENPMFSSLTVTGGPLFAYELDQQDRLAEHVVLSACDVGRNSVRSGQETLGLTSVLLQLGCASVVAGVARVHDDLAAEIMVGYHRELAEGRTAAEALCLIGQRVDAPSPFVCFGAAWSA